VLKGDFRGNGTPASGYAPVLAEREIDKILEQSGSMGARVLVLTGIHLGCSDK
jgi:hypothetical protein